MMIGQDLEQTLVLPYPKHTWQELVPAEVVSEVVDIAYG